MQGYDIQQNSAAFPLVFMMIQSSDHITGSTGLSPTVSISKNGGAFATPSGAVSEMARGWYKVAGNATDSNTLGPLVLNATGVGTDPWDCLYPVVAFNPQSTAFGTIVAVTGGAPVNFLPPGATVSVTGVSSSFWTTAEQNQIRYKLGLDGTATAPASGFSHIELSPSGVDRVMVESNINMRQALTIDTAVLAGTSSGNAPWIWYQAINGPTQNRLSSSSTSGIRTAVNYVLP